ncbi:zinc-binding metallopeptidase family protein [Methylophaga sp. OBS3]|uniref:zinc-binding metallopeptidase family protein n=1 Tax=Methylophaga sp. OBS3 TaxID=2991934 RepID=UPI002256DFC8|nr:putative zinc-binding metallopeptidase [Methylophaga sp. OBS3]MCX4189641.1 putative zinc-binding peptidase [Methylophaga sp. OBS3]
MKRFYCQCGQELFFDNSHCNHCGINLGFDPQTMMVIGVTAEEGSQNVLSFSGQRFRRCQLHEQPVGCNWLIAEDDDHQQCISCRLTRMIPSQDTPQNQTRWQVLEKAKRRMIYGLLDLGLPIELANHPLNFDFLEDQRSNANVAIEQVLSGHAGGVITINAAEADSSYREATREAMNEPYRTLLGHFRHEIGHYYWQQITDPELASAFSSLFGNPETDYAKALEDYYRDGPEQNWQENYISAYASAHPLEDWAETWAHYLLMHETLETALAFQVINAPDKEVPFSTWLSEWLQLVLVLNALNRSIGNADAYPFVVTPAVEKKLQFIDNLVRNWATVH